MPKSSVLKKMMNRKMLAILLLGMSSGVPLGAVLSVLQAWLTKSGIDLKTLGLVSLVQLPYTWKFVWSPILDRYKLPFLGRRRGWMLIFQILMVASLALLGHFDPASDVSLILVISFFVAFFGASHDIVIDAYRRDVLDDDELGFGSALAVNGYLIGYRYLAVVLGLLLADVFPWSQVYHFLALMASVGIIGTLIGPEADGNIAIPTSLKAAVLDPLKDFFKRSGAIEILIFILLYKIGDNFAQNMLTPFYLKIGFSLSQIAWIGKFIGFWATFGGGLIAGLILIRYSLPTSLLFFGILQAISTLAFAGLAMAGPNVWALGITVGFENFTAGMGSAAFAAFMAKLSNRQFSATQYALLSSLMGVPRVVIPAGAGFVAEAVGWVPFFVISTVIAIPGLLMVIFRAKKWVSTTT